MKFSTELALLLLGFKNSTLLKKYLNYASKNSQSLPKKTLATNTPLGYKVRLVIFKAATIKED
jgi:hypothetical protein